MSEYEPKFIEVLTSFVEDACVGFPVRVCNKRVTYIDVYDKHNQWVITVHDDSFFSGIEIGTISISDCMGFPMQYDWRISLESIEKCIKRILTRYYKPAW
jgi:hypothetical protein